MQTVSQRLRAKMPQLPPAELKAARVLLADYPVAGLTTTAAVAAAAGISAPTVLRLVDRLGFGSYPEFQQALRRELQEQARIPLRQATEYQTESEPLGRSRQVFVQGLEETFERLDPADFAEAVALLASPRHTVYATGGRFTTVLAKTLVMLLEVLRPRTHYLSVEDRTSVVIDLGPRDVVFAADLRRYQPSTVTFAAEAAARGARVILLTDHWMSPIAQHADAVLTTSLDAPHPLDSIVHAMAVVEALVTGVLDAVGDLPIERMKRYDEAWATHGFTSTSSTHPASTPEN
jgi:DNA-binding MurR/RpiR family transcriptional regulator